MVCKLQKEAVPALNGSSGERAVGSSSFVRSVGSQSPERAGLTLEEPRGEPRMKAQGWCAVGVHVQEPVCGCFCESPG